jgi:hypothetical protein
MVMQRVQILDLKQIRGEIQGEQTRAAASSQHDRAVMVVFARHRPMQKAHQPKLMGFSRILVGSTSFELVTPAV